MVMGINSVMAVGAHADDVELICGGTLSKYRDLYGYEVCYVMSTNNMSGVFSFPNPAGGLKSKVVPWYEMEKQRHLEADIAAKECYGTTAIHLNHPQRHYTDEKIQTVDLRFGNPPPSDLETNLPTIITASENKICVESMADLILGKNPAVIFTHTAVDPNPEHTSTCWLVVKAFRKAAEKGYTGSLLFAAGRHNSEAAEFFEGGDTFIDISGQWHEKKVEALAKHKCQSAGLFAAECCENFKEIGKSLGVGSAELFIIHRINAKMNDPLTAELTANTGKCRT